MRTAFQVNNTNPNTLSWKADLLGKKCLHLQYRKKYFYQSKITTGKVKLKRYSDRNKVTFMYAAMEWFTLNRIFARRVNENDKNTQADLIAVVESKKVYIILNPKNSPLPTEKLTLFKEECSLLIANDMNEMTDFFKDYLK